MRLHRQHLRLRRRLRTAAGLQCAVLVPEGKISMGKLSQAIAHGATLLQVDGNFDDCLDIARKLGESYPVFLVNSVNPARIEGQKTGAFEVVDFLGDAPDFHVLPVGNAGNITAYWKGYKEYAAPFESPTAGTLPAVSTKTPSCGASRPPARPLRRRPPDHRTRHHRHGHPDRQPGLLGHRRSPPATSPAA